MTNDKKTLDKIASAIRLVAGDPNGEPSGLELLAMQLKKPTDGADRNIYNAVEWVSDGLDSATDGLNSIALALNRIADVIERTLPGQYSGE